MVLVVDGGFGILDFSRPAESLWEENFGVELEDLTIEGTAGWKAKDDGATWTEPSLMKEILDSALNWM